MKKLSEVSIERLKSLNGCEIMSMEYADCVGIDGNKVFRYGEHIDTLDTDEKITVLWQEYLEDSGVSEEIAELLAEFQD